MNRALLFLWLLPLSAFAQLQLFQFDGINETPQPSGFANNARVPVGTASPGDTITTRFKVRNSGAGPATFPTLSLSGQGFHISAGAPSPGDIMSPDSEREFDVTFQPPQPPPIIVSFSATLQVGAIAVILQGFSQPAAVLTLAGSQAPLISGAVIDFGSVLRGGSQPRSFTLTNPGAADLAVGNVAVSGAGFRGPIGLAAPIALAPGQAVSFQVAFEPQTGQPAQGTLSVDQRAFTLTGIGLNPPLPGAAIVLASTLGASAQQDSLSIALASASEVSGNGTLTMAFHSSVAGVTDDSAIRFLTGPKRAATVTISPGDSVAKFGGQSSIGFQTGATAGTIVFTLTLPNGTQQSNLVITPSPVNFDLSITIRKAGELDVSLTGLDNTYSAAQLAFTFYDAKGATVQPGVIRVDASPDFRQYFSSAPAGGTLALLARFPVSGDTSQIVSVDVQITNSAGTTTVQKIPIVN